MNNRDDIVNKLKSSGVSPTSQRVDIAQVLFARPQHLSAEQMLKMTQKRQRRRFTIRLVCLRRKV